MPADPPVDPPPAPASPPSPPSGKPNRKADGGGSASPAAGSGGGLVTATEDGEAAVSPFQPLPDRENERIVHDLVDDTGRSVPLPEDLAEPGPADTWMVGELMVDRGHPQPYGPTPTPRGVNFALYSRHAAAVTLVLYKDDDGAPVAEIPLDPRVNRTGDVWHIRCQVARQVRYLWRVDGPCDGVNRFDGKLLLLDPYARALSGGEQWGEPLASTGPRAPSPRRNRLAPGFYRWGGDRHLRTPLEDTVIYELHVRGFTIDPSAGVAAPGTFRGLAEKIPYLQRLGVTAVELMPVFEFDENENHRRNPDTGEALCNYWGYSPVAFFCPKNGYARDARDAGAIREFRDMVKAFHAAGIEVILDVVFNHTAEGDERGPTLSFKGLDNQVYYMLDARGRYRNFSGCGNTLNCNHPLLRTLILDVLHYWVGFMHVDGFRFDLASILGRGRDGEVLANPPLLERIALDPVLADTKIIAEAWDAGGLNQVGHFPSYGRWAEWNGYYRDDIRRFWRGDRGAVSAAASRLCGSDDLYFASGRRPNHSINFITAHDGFTLHDLVSYEEKRNHANGEDNRDGENNNLSRNYGHEGPTGDFIVNRVRQRQMRNFCATLLLSQGTPMLLGGDEFARTQRGNNNAYCQDNGISWLDWSLADKNAPLLRFFENMVAFRRRHAVLRRTRFFGGTKDIVWHGERLNAPDWSANARWLAFLLPGARHGDDDLFVILNAAEEWRHFELPDRGHDWRRVIDTAKPSPDDIFADERAAPPVGRHQARFAVEPQSTVVLVAKRG